MRNRQQDILEHMKAMVAELDAGGRMTYVSETVTDLLGYSPQEIQGHDGLDWVHPDDVARLAELFGEALRSGRSSRLAFRARHKAGHWIWMETTARGHRADDGSQRLVAFTRDISELVRADEALRQTRDRLQILAENTSDILLELDAEGRYLYVSPGCQALLGVPPDALVGRTVDEPAVADRIHPEDRESVLRGFRALVAAGEGSGSAEYRYRHADGSWRWFESRSRIYRTGDEALRVAVVARDVTERRRAEHDLRESEERYRVLTEATSDLISETDAEGRLVYASATLKDLLGYAPEEVVGTTPLPLVLHPDDLEPAAQAFVESIHTGQPARANVYRMRHRDGSWRWFESTAVPYRRGNGEMRMLGVTRDITEGLRQQEEQRGLEARMQHHQKLESLGAMAGGIAHDFNNLLTPILGDASLIQKDLPPDSPLRERLERIQKSAHRAAALTSQMLAYAGERPLLAEPVNLSRLVLEMAQLIESSVGKRAVVSFDMAADLPLVEGDVSQLSQVVMNLVANSSEAIGKQAGRIELCTGSAPSPRGLRRSELFGADLRPGPCVYLEVRDTGCGMDEQTRSRIFDPFFTTKFIGRGLGLAAALGIVRSHAGAIAIETESGLGTRVRVILPAADPTQRRAIAAPAAQPWRGNGTALVIDDEDGVRDLVRETLERAGLAVVCAGDANEALRIFGHRPDRIDVVILDCTLPGRPGRELFDELRTLRPDAPILLMSGYGAESLAARFGGKPRSGFVQKPFLPDTLVDCVRAILEGA